MGILNRLFKKENDDLPTPEQEKRKRTRVDRAPRVQLGALHHISFHQKEPPVSTPLQLANLSTSGVGFMKSSSTTWPSTGSILKGDFLVAGSEIATSLQIVHISAKIVGCRIIENNAEVERMVNDYFNLELSAVRLIPVNPAILKSEPDGKPQWFKGENNCELYVVEKEQRLVRYNLSFFGNYIEGSPRTALKYGHIVEDEELKEGPKYKGSSIVRLVSDLPVEIIDLSLKFLTNIESLDKGILEEIQTTLKPASS